MVLTLTYYGTSASIKVNIKVWNEMIIIWEIEKSKVKIVFTEL